MLFVGVGHFERKFHMEGASPTDHCWCQKTRVIDLSCGIKKSAVYCFVLPQSTRVTNRQNYDSQDRASIAGRAVKVKEDETKITEKCDFKRRLNVPALFSETLEESSMRESVQRYRILFDKLCLPSLRVVEITKLRLHAMRPVVIMATNFCHFRHLT